LASSKIFFDNAYPNVLTQASWLEKSLVDVLQKEAQMDQVAREVNLRASQDPAYMHALISMVCHSHLPPNSYQHGFLV
jgi:hypothetical protein